MSSEIDEAHKRLVSLQPELGRAAVPQLNEASTRFHLLDRVLIECLGWPNDQIGVEEGADEGFVDYTLRSINDRPLLVIEAKRLGSLDLSSATQAATEVALNGKLLRPLRQAIRQAVGYAAMQSVSIACVTDGNLWLFFQTNRRDGHNLLEGKGILFPSLQSVLSRFPTFHDLISPSGLREGLGMVQLNRAEGIRVANEEDQRTVSPPDEAHMRPRDSLAHDASLLFRQFFAGIGSDSDPDMLRECFVETPESQKADLELQKIAQKLLSGIETLDTGAGAALQDQLERAVSAMQSETVLLVGNKGAGKTTFLSRFFGGVLPSHLQKQCYVIRVPLDAIPEVDKERAASWALVQLRDRIERALCGNRAPTYDELRGVFFSEYNRLKDGPLAPLYKRDPEEFRHQFGLSLEQMRANQPEAYALAFLRRAVANDRRLPVIIFDNADQFPAGVQDNIFQLAHSFTIATPVLNIVPITDRTVWRLSRHGALQSYTSRSFYLPVPEAKKILQKRIDYVYKKLNTDPNTARTYFSSKGFRVELKNLDHFAQAVERIFVQNDFVSGLIGRLANFDIRRMLLVAERIFLSPEIRIDEVLKGSFGFNPGKSEILRIHRALIKGEYDRYSYKENEFVYNIFWTDQSWPASPVLGLHILWMLKARLAKARSESIDTRHWTANEICQFLEPTGAHPDQTMVVLKRLIERGLIEPLDPSVEVVATSSRVAITDSGVAHIDLVRNSDVYMEQMAMATGLNSLRVFEEIRNERTKANAASFAKIRQIFAQYLYELDVDRMKLPKAKEYEGLREARLIIQGLISPTPRGTWDTPVRSSPAESIGIAAVSRKWV